MWSAVRSIPSGQGSVVARVNIIFAFGLFAWNLYSKFVDEWLRKFSRIGPHRP